MSPPSLQRDVLRTIATSSIGRTVQQIAAEVLPWRETPAYSIPIRVSGLDARRAARAAHDKASRASVSRALNRLHTRGYVTSADVVRLCPASLDAHRRHGLDGLCCSEPQTSGGSIVGWIVPESSRHVGPIVAHLASHPYGVSCADLSAATGGLTPSGGRRGAWWAAYRSLVEDGTVIPPGARRVKVAGILALGRYG